MLNDYKKSVIGKAYLSETSTENLTVCDGAYSYVCYIGLH